jgi:hypothetical protein
MIGSGLELALLFVGAVTRSMLAACARQQARSLGLEYNRGVPAVLPPASEVEHDAAEAVEAIKARK